MTSSQAKIEELIRAHIWAIDDDAATAGYVSGGPGSRLLQRSALWHEGEQQFVELERAYRRLGGATEYRHLRARYYGATVAVRVVRRRGHDWLGLGPNEGVVSIPAGPRVDVSAASRGRHKATVSERVAVETWPAWVELQRVGAALQLVHDSFLAAGVEPCVPSSVWTAA